MTFRTDPSSDMNAVEVLAVVDGRPFSEIVMEFEASRGWDPAGGYGGLFPGVFRLGTAIEYWLGVGLTGFGSTGGRVWVLGCECGELGCWPFGVTIVTTPDTVTWQSFEQPFRRERDYSALPPFIFDRAEYVAAVTTVAHLFTRTAAP
ncbi:hypothetical protein B7R54_08980 [Subtercola boreus]|uniref:Uncharacterized protein n=2 Tax=Subtercola boreus TaxID=120213 RepID=A0A3E0VIY8_9MICO|nr:hypothetical protein B7R54_08980 [Subtercola boreus]TQL53617.1 hypothetical protein FB464_1132 [Subtercola boreus]